MNQSKVRALAYMSRDALNESITAEDFANWSVSRSIEIMIDHFVKYFEIK